MLVFVPGPGFVIQLFMSIIIVEEEKTGCFASRADPKGRGQIVQTRHLENHQ